MFHDVYRGLNHSVKSRVLTLLKHHKIQALNNNRKSHKSTKIKKINKMSEKSRKTQKTLEKALKIISNSKTFLRVIHPSKYIMKNRFYLLLIENNCQQQLKHCTRRCGRKPIGRDFTHYKSM